MKTLKLFNSFVLITGLAIVFLSSSCSFYRVVPIPQYTSSSIHSYDTSGKYMVLKRGDEAWHMYDIQVQNDSITASLDIYLGYNVNHLNPKTKGVNQFKRKEEPDVEYTLHLFTNDSSFSTYDTVITIHESSIYKINKFDYAQGPSRASIIVPIVLVPVGVMVLIGAAMANTINNWSVSGNTSFQIK